MPTSIENENILSSFKLKDEEFVVIPKSYFLKLKRDYSNFMDNQEYPKLYTEVDEEGTWETIDFGPEGIDPQELLLVHKELEEGKEV